MVKGFYVVVNYKTYERKSFSTFRDFQDWYRHLGINEASEWSGWQYVEMNECSD